MAPGAATLVRKLSFGRKPKEKAAAAAPAANGASAAPSSSADAAGPSSSDAEPKPSAAGTPGSGVAATKRRTLSFGRRGRGQGAAKPESKAPAAAAIARAPPSREGLQPQPPREARLHIKRTNSWQRGHRQARDAAKASQIAAGRALLSSAVPLLAALPPQQRAQLARVCKRLSEAAREVAAADEATPPALGHTCFTHEGGAGGKGKENQDTYFVAHPSKDVALYAVFDGHGKQYGRLAAHAAAAASKAFLSAHHRWVLDCPRDALRYAFGVAHEAVRVAMRRSDPAMRSCDGSGDAFLVAWMATGDDGDDGEPTHKWDAADGGTTATIAAVLRGQTLVVAAVGDSAAVLMARDEGGSGGDDAGGEGGGEGGAGKPAHQLLVDEHSPTNVLEYERMRYLPSGPRLKFVYDCPDFEEFDIFCDDADGHAMLDPKALALADEHSVMIKNSRDDRFTLLMIPEETVAVPAAAPGGGPGGGACGGGPSGASTVVEEQAITMTRSIGDFYAHAHGVVWEPEVRTLQLGGLAEKRWRQSLLLLASDGVWDLWGYDEVAQELVSPQVIMPPPLPHTHPLTRPPLSPHDRACTPTPCHPPTHHYRAHPLLACRRFGLVPQNAQTSRMAERGAEFCEKTRAKGAYYFDEAADNLTGLLVHLDAAVAAAQQPPSQQSEG